jgi:hypothetical protein
MALPGIVTIAAALTLREKAEIEKRRLGAPLP